MLRPDLFESVDLRNAACQIKCMSRKSDLEYYETDPVEKAQVPDAKVIDSLLSRRQNMFRPPPTDSEHQQRAAAVAAAAAAAAAVGGSTEAGRRAQTSAGRSRYLLVNASNELVSSFNHISMREGQLSRGKFVTITFHVRQPSWFDQLRQVYVNAKPELEKLLSFMRRSRCSSDAGTSGEDVDFQDFVKAERELIYSDKNLRQWAYKFDVELRRDTLMRHAIDAFQCRLGLDGCDNLGYSFGLFMDECLCTGEPTPRQVLGDSTPDNYQIAGRADIFVTNYFSMAANRAFREEIIAVLYKAFVRDTAQQQRAQQLQQTQESLAFGQFWDRSDAGSQQKQQLQQQLQQQRQMQLSSEFAPTKANTLTLYEKKSQQQQQQQHRLAAAAAAAAAAATASAVSVAAAGVAAVQARSRPSQAGGGGVGGGASVVRIQVPNSRRAAESVGTEDDAATDNNESLASASVATPTRLAARSQLLYVGNT